MKKAPSKKIIKEKFIISAARIANKSLIKPRKSSHVNYFTGTYRAPWREWYVITNINSALHAQLVLAHRLKPPVYLATAAFLFPDFYCVRHINILIYQIYKFPCIRQS